MASKKENKISRYFFYIGGVLFFIFILGSLCIPFLLHLENYLIYLSIIALSMFITPIMLVYGVFAGIGFFKKKKIGISKSSEFGIVIVEMIVGFIVLVIGIFLIVISFFSLLLFGLFLFCGIDFIAIGILPLIDSIRELKGANILKERKRQHITTQESSGALKGTKKRVNKRWLIYTLSLGFLSFLISFIFWLITGWVLLPVMIGAAVFMASYSISLAIKLGRENNTDISEKKE